MTRTPGGTISRSMTATVTIEAIDTKVPSVTVKKEDGKLHTHGRVALLERAARPFPVSAT